MMVPLTVDGGVYSFTHILLFCFSSFFSLFYEESKQALNATVKFEGTESTNSTHTPTYMLSRVAAVMAIRTHNRRRVTGSRGRRREGGESERQRPNMSRRVFTSAVLLLVVMMWCGTGVAKAEEPSSFPKFQWKDTTEGETVDSLGVPGLLKVGSDVFAVAEAQCKKDENSFTGIASKLLTLSDEPSKEEFDATQVKTQVLVECSSDD
ncbi:trans-sialidase, putative, partial [Trypanosoma cruzi]